MSDDFFRDFGEAAGFFTEVEVKAWYKESYTQFANLAECLVDHKHVHVIENIMVKPPGFKRLLAMDTNSNRFATEYEEGTGHFTLRGVEIPDNVSLRYVALPSEDPKATFPQLTADGLKTQLTEYGDLALKDWVKYRALEADDREREAQAAKKDFTEKAVEEFARARKLRKIDPIRTSAWTGRQIQNGLRYNVR